MLSTYGEHSALVVADMDEFIALPLEGTTVQEALSQCFSGTLRSSAVSSRVHSALTSHASEYGSSQQLVSVLPQPCLSPPAAATNVEHRTSKSAGRPSIKFTHARILVIRTGDTTVILLCKSYLQCSDCRPGPEVTSWIDHRFSRPLAFAHPLQMYSLRSDPHCAQEHLPKVSCNRDCSASTAPVKFHSQTESP